MNINKSQTYLVQYSETEWSDLGVALKEAIKTLEQKVDEATGRNESQWTINDLKRQLTRVQYLSQSTNDY